MAQYTSILKPSSYLTLQEVAEWLNIKPTQYNIPQPEVKASKLIQDLQYTSKLTGVLGNAITIVYNALSSPGPVVVNVVSNAIEVQIEDGVSTSQQIKDAIEAFADSNALVTIAFKEGSTGVETQVLQAVQNLVGGINDVPWKENAEELRRLLERMINIACDKVTQILQTSVIAKPFEETIDGNSSNVILPSKWPIVSVQEVKIDYNRGFSSETIISDINRLLRGYADIRQEPTDTELRIVGNDIVLRDDGRDAIVGKIFSGSVIQAIKIKYTAGWAKDANDIPFDLRHATTLLVEYYYFQRSNRDLNITSKGVRGESFSKIKDGIPDTILELLEPYKDISMPLFEKSQTNSFGD